MKLLQKSILHFIFIIIFSFAYSQREEIKLLEKRLAAATSDTAKFPILDSLSSLYEEIHPKTALKYAEDALQIAQKISASKKIIQTRYSIARIYFSLGELNKAIEFHLLSLKSKKEEYGTELNNEEKISLARSYHNMGNVYYAMGDFSKCMDSFYKALNLREEIGDKTAIYYTMNNVGLVNVALKNYDKALQYFEKTLALMEEKDSTGNKIGKDMPKSNTLHNIGLVYYNNQNYDSALVYYFSALELRKKVNDPGSIAESYNNIGLVYYETNNKKQAIDYYMKAMELMKQINDKYSLSAAYSNLGAVYSEMNHNDKAIEFFRKGLDISTEINAKEWIKDNSRGIAEVYAKKNDFKNAFEHFKLFSQVKDTLYSEESLRQMHEMEAKYETEQKQKQIEIQDLQLGRQELELNQKQIVIYAVSGGLALMLVLAFVIYRNYSQKKKMNFRLTEKNIIIEQKNKDITDSIEYAKTLQDAILPDIENIKKILPGSFIFFRPRDIVSGDFYWFHFSSELSQLPTVFLAACDCTGHGVPGAFVSMVCNNVLNEAIIQKEISEPGKILTEVNKGVSEVFKKEGTKARANDGMDIALIKYQTQNGKPVIEFAGAMNPALLVRNKEVIELPADKMSIGGFTKTDFNFKTHSLELQKNDCIYIFSDGFHDQFGGAKGKKFMFRRFKETLLQIAELSPRQQSDELEKSLTNWQGNYERVDDVLVIGIKV